MAHPNWRPAKRTPAPIGVQSQPGRVQVPAAKQRPVRRVRELVGKRTANARYFQLSDGRVQAEVSADAVNYRDGRGRFRLIDTSVVPVSRSGFAYGSEKNTFASYFSRDRARVAQVVVGGHAVTMGTPQAGSLSPSVSGDSVRYRGALGGADLDYAVTPTGLKERIVLARAVKDPTYTFTLDLGGLTAKPRRDGSIGLCEGGRLVAVMPKPFMVDSRPDRDSPYGTVWSPKVTQTLSADGRTVTVRADSAWLHDGSRKFPVTIDPTIVIAPTVSQSQDAMILSDDPSSNFDGNWRLSWARRPRVRRAVW